MPKFIPRKVMVLVALILLPLSAILTGWWIFTDSGIYHFLTTLLGNTSTMQGLSAIFTLLINLIFVLIVVFAMRLFARDMPSLSQQLGTEAAIMKGPGTLEEKMAKLQQIEAAHDAAHPDAAAGKEKAVAVGIITLGIALVIVGGASVLLTNGDIFVFQIVLVLSGIISTVVGFVRLVSNKTRTS